MPNITRFLIGIFYCCIISIVIFISNKEWAAQKVMELNQAKIQPSNQLHLNNLKTKHRTHHQLRNQQQLQTQTHRQQSQQLWQHNRNRKQVHRYMNKNWQNTTNTVKSIMLSPLFYPIGWIKELNHGLII